MALYQLEWLDEKLIYREDQIDLLFFHAVKVLKIKSIALHEFDEVVGCL